MFKKTLGILLLVQFLLISGVVCQQNGDVRLNHYGDFYKYNGILEVFLTEANEWVPVCYDQFNDGAAAAACRQMGYCSYDNYRKGSSYDNIEYSYTNVSCSDHGDYKDYGQLHLLRCEGSTQQQKCSQDPVYLVCDRTCFIKTDNPYSGQIYLYNDTSYLNSSGILYLYYDNHWLPVCARSFNQYAADSACRQLGYTNAINQGGYKESGTSFSWDINTIKCRDESYSCFKNCSSVPSKQHCPNYKITCTFNPANKDTSSSGSKPECAYNTPPTTCPSHDDTGYIVGLVILGLYTVLLTLAVIGLRTITKYRPRRRNYDPIAENNN